MSWEQEKSMRNPQRGSWLWWKAVAAVSHPPVIRTSNGGANGHESEVSAAPEVIDVMAKVKLCRRI
jgi:hypothetical protein